MGRGALFRRRDATVHVDGVAFAFEPFIAFRLRLTPSAGQRLFEKIHTLIEAVTSHLSIGRPLPDAVHGVAGDDDVFALEFHVVHAEFAGDLGHGGLHGEDGLRRSVPAESPRGWDVGVNGVAETLHVRTAVDLERLAEGGSQGLAAMIAVGAGGGNHAELNRRERSEERRVGKECRSRWSPYH